MKKGLIKIELVKSDRRKKKINPLLKNDLSFTNELKRRKG